MRWRAIASGFLVFALGAVSTEPGRADSVEAHETGDDVRIRVEADGRAHVAHTLSLRVLAGEKHTIELLGVEREAVPVPRATLVSDDGRTLEGSVTTKTSRDASALEVAVGDPRGLRRGRYRVELAYDVDLLAAHELGQDAGMWRLSWRGPVPPEGLDSARVVFDLPPAATTAAPVRPDSDAPDDTVVSTLRRGRDRDELEIVRPHIGRGEIVTWSVRLAPRALGSAPVPAAAVRQPEPWSGRLTSLAALAFLAGLGFAALVWKKHAAFGAACARVGRALPVQLLGSIPLRAACAGIAIGSGVALQGAGWPTRGASCIAVAMVLASVRHPVTASPVRGPGRWLVLRPADAFSADPAQPRALLWLDLGTLRGKALFFASACLVVVVGWAVRWWCADAPYLAVLDALALVPVFATGTVTQLPADASRAVAFLENLHRRLGKLDGLRVSPWARWPSGTALPDEVRLLVLPRLPMPGVVGIEVGLTTATSRTEFSISPEVLIRVTEATPAATRMARLVPGSAPVPGRRPEERVYRLLPRFPTGGWTRALVLKLTRELADRRLDAGEPWGGLERRTAAVRREERLVRAA